MEIKSSRRSSCSLENANVSIPDLTNDVRSFIASLGNSPGELYLKEQAWSKFVSNETDPPELRKSRAIAKWLDQEALNRETNDRLIELESVNQDYHILPRVDYASFMRFLSSLVETTIGSLPPEDALLGGFSGGASTSRSRDNSAPAGKFTGQAHITARASGIAQQMFELCPGWTTYVNPDEYLVQHGSNSMFTVPKNTTIDRVACKEPDVNMFLQKGMGNHIRHALRRVGVNLNDQTINQRLARKGSRDGSLATLDLSSASDSVTRELVFQVMPICWFTLLDSTRSEVTMIGDEEHVNEMFSSMGNGFTFELESLIFWAIARTVCYFRGISGTVSVYGDDIIVPVDAAEDLAWVLSVLGFRVNTEKSFWQGPFRESCGGHYHMGIDISPFFVRRPVDSLVEAILLCNNIRTWSGRCGMAVLDPTLFPLWEYVASHIPDRLWGGTDLGSTTRLVSVHEPLKPQRLEPLSERKDNGVGGLLHWLCACRENLEAVPEIITGFDISLRITSRLWDPSRSDVLQWTRTRRRGYSGERELITSLVTKTVETYRLKRARKRIDVASVLPFVGIPDDSRD